MNKKNEILDQMIESLRRELWKVERFMSNINETAPTWPGWIKRRQYIQLQLKQAESLRGDHRSRYNESYRQLILRKRRRRTK